MNLRKCCDLYVSFFKIGGLTFGGGLAMLPMLQRETVDNHGWCTEEELLDIYAIGQCTPGIIAVNTATYIGYKISGVLGSAVSTIGVCIPSFVIIYIISLFFDRFMQFEIVASAFKGIQVCVVYLIFSAGLKMLKNIKKNVLSYILISLTVICMIAFSLFAVKFSAIFYILIGAVIGIFAYLIGFKLKKEEKK